MYLLIIRIGSESKEVFYYRYVGYSRYKKEK